MNRRDFLKTLAFGLIGWGITPELLAQNTVFPPGTFSEILDDYIRDYLHKMKQFNESHKNDIYIEGALYKNFESTLMRLRRLVQLVGYTNFQILSFDDGIRIARKYSQVGKFDKEETGFMEKLFYTEVKRYGFFGQKPLKEITCRIRKEDVVKVPYTGNYLYRGVPLDTYKKIKQQVGEEVILTSGVRGIIKQFFLFLNKAYKSNGNLSLASRSLAPPGYSFHGNGDFDVGQAGFGVLNFTEHFTATEVYKRLTDLGYIKLRYPRENLLGVRFEPWHIRVTLDG